MTFNEDYLEAAHVHCFENGPEVRASSRVGCIACARNFEASLVTEIKLLSRENEETAFCPVCSFDTIIGDASGYPVENADFLIAMSQKYQNGPIGSDDLWEEFLGRSQAGQLET